MAVKRRHLDPNVDISDLLAMPIDELHARRRVVLAQIETARSQVARGEIENLRMLAAIRARKHEETDLFGVSDHALLRWIERKLKLDVNMLRKTLRKEVSARRNPLMMNEVVDLGDGMRAAIVDGRTVSTIWDSTTPEPGSIPVEPDAIPSIQIRDYELKMTSFASPEAYDVLKEGKRIGHMRLRHGLFKVELFERATDDETGVRLVFSATPDGDAKFEPGERDRYLNEAVEAIAAHVQQKRTSNALKPTGSRSKKHAKEAVANSA